MATIRQMHHQLSDKIAAGEVVERPASVVKELLENAVDAKATKITVEVEEAGLKSIRVSDNGIGMDAEDAYLALKRHATSKVMDEHDLFRIRTLGFRGEALPSIASVSRLTLATSTGQGPGISLHFAGGECKEEKKVHSRQGTDVLVEDLFFNTPARLKYIRSLHTELGHITEAVNRIALSSPSIQMKLVHDGRVLLQTGGQGRRDAVLAKMYGMDVARALQPIAATSSDFTIEGYIAQPSVTRASRHYFSFVLNGRFVKNIALYQAVLEGYKTLLPIGRYPVGVIAIDMDPMLIDVNVHPAKLEVRLSKEKELCHLLTTELKRALRQESLAPRPGQMATPRRMSEQGSWKLEQDSLPVQEEVSTAPSSPIVLESEVTLSPERGTADSTRVAHHTAEEASTPEEELTNDTPSTPVTYSREEAAVYSSEQLSSYKLPYMEVIGQHHGSYILAQSEEGLHIIDQHAAQERIKYEYYYRKLGEDSHEEQGLIVPLTLTFSHKDYLRLLEETARLHSLGIQLEDFGNGSVIVRSHPTWFPAGKEADTTQDLIQQVLDRPEATVADFREEAAIMMACKKSIKANMYLRHEDMQRLLDDLRQAKDPYTCPHGRPVVLNFSPYELEKMFKRVM
ncbi:DNA mismatch repair endonuclease MutL [Bacillaceae bacterium SIJ1]|uniref:DNA mismatch repair endonuclease MutL n=1 Tax=Litoribacterium kuwaitense TaxID=1398745 RepID=UPI0013EBBA58|nr:DNA mismatch repair endonuclease MutL [Litoribacterium kuwaitense]NGP44056.1 DNA mismatch repair endonuclease MutL [Litoribacterium kuwaitense]